MIRDDPSRRPDEPASGPADDETIDDDELVEEEEPDAPDAEAADELSEATGIDLTDASELDADNVPADEESDRVLQAPD